MSAAPVFPAAIIPRFVALKALLLIIVLVNGALWLSVRNSRPVWTNVPPAPTPAAAAIGALGDRQFAYRSAGLSLQNFGDTGGRVTSLADYNYDELYNWLMLEHALDPRSNFTPALAGFLFGASKNPDALVQIIDYLAVAAKVDAPQKWRWLAQAVFLARHRLEDTDLALRLAYELAAMDQPDMPAWARQMPGFVLNAQGEKQAALELMLNLIKTEGENLHPNEVNAIKAYICEQIYTPSESAQYALCQEN